jgi:alpha-galactosidase
VIFKPVADMPISADGPAAVYAEGWQSWSPVRTYRVGETSTPAPDERSQSTGWRPGKPVPEGVIQAEGVLAVAPEDGPALAWFAPEPRREVPTMRLHVRGKRLEVTADGAVEEVQSENLAGALAAVGDRLSIRRITKIPPGWCSWSCYFGHVTEEDIVENVEAAVHMSLPIEIAQIDEGYETAIGDWLDVAPRFGSLRRIAERIGSAGMRAGIWTAPFMVSPGSNLARLHPEWLVKDADAGLHWNQRMRILDVTHPEAADHLAGVFRTLSDWGFNYFKIDFLYAGAIDGIRRMDCSAIEAYQAGLRLIRSAVGPDATLVACGAPLLPSIGLCDAMRIGPDVLPEAPNQQPDLANLIGVTSTRSWMNGRLWVNDPDCLVARPEVDEREAWASYLESYGGITFSGDRLTTLDQRGLQLTRRVLSRSLPLTERP